MYSFNAFIGTNYLSHPHPSIFSLIPNLIPGEKYKGNFFNSSEIFSQSMLPFSIIKYFQFY